MHLWTKTVYNGSIRFNPVQWKRGEMMNIDDDYIKDIEEGLAKILEEIMKEEK